MDSASYGPYINMLGTDISLTTLHFEALGYYII